MDRHPGTARIIRGNTLALPLADDSVDLVVTSPPYFGLRSYQDGGEHYDGQIGAEATPAEFVDALIAATREIVRVVKPSGSIWVNLGDKYAGVGGPNNSGASVGETARKVARSQNKLYAAGVRKGAPQKSLMGIPWRYALRCIDDLGLILRAEVIWSKPNGLPESVTDRVRRSHETWFHFTLNPRYYSAVDEIREAYLPPSGGRDQSTYGTQRERTIVGGGPRSISEPNPLGKLPGSVWSIPIQPLKVPEHVAHAVCCGGRMRPGCEDGLAHYAAFPMEWPRRIIRGWSPPGGVVLDPFGGTGTTALVAKALGRDGISVDMSADYCRLATWRTNDPAQIARATQGPKPRKPAKQAKGQAPLLDLIEGGAA